MRLSFCLNFVLTYYVFFKFVNFYSLRRFLVYDVAREDEYSPLKNAIGSKDGNADTCRRDLYALHDRYLRAAGAQLSDSDAGDGERQVVRKNN